MPIQPDWLTAGGTIATGLGALIAGWAAVRGVDAWRAEIVERRKAELAEEVLAQFYRARDVLSWARLPDRPVVGPKDEAEAPTDQRDRLHRSLVSPIERLTQESALFSDLQASRYRFMAYFGEEAARPFEQIGAIHGEVMSSARSLIHDPAEIADDADPNRWEDAIGWGGDDDDALARRLSDTIAAVERICRPLIAEQHSRRRRTRGG